MASKNLIKGHDELITTFQKKNGNLKKLCKKMLLAAGQATQEEINKASAGYKLSGAMIGAEITPQVEQVGSMAFRCKVGFEHNEGGVHAILLNYGTPKKKKGKVVKGTGFYTNAIRRASRRRKDLMTIQIQKEIEKL